MQSLHKGTVSEGRASQEIVRNARMKTSWTSSSQMMPAMSTSGEGRRRISLAKQPVLSISSRTLQSILPAELASVQGWWLHMLVRSASKLRCLAVWRPHHQRPCHHQEMWKRVLYIWEISRTLNHINKHKPATCKGERNICTVSPWPSSPEGGVKTPAVTVRPYVPFTPSDSSIGLVQKVSRAYRLFRSPHCDIVGWPDKIHKLNMNYILNTYIYDCCKIDEVPDCHDLALTNGGGSSLPKR